MHNLHGQSDETDGVPVSIYLYTGYVNLSFCGTIFRSDLRHVFFYYTSIMGSVLVLLFNYFIVRWRTPWLPMYG